MMGELLERGMFGFRDLSVFFAGKTLLIVLGDGLFSLCPGEEVCICTLHTKWNRQPWWCYIPCEKLFAYVWSVQKGAVINVTSFHSPISHIKSLSFWLYTQPNIINKNAILCPMSTTGLHVVSTALWRAYLFLPFFVLFGSMSLFAPLLFGAYPCWTFFLHVAPPAKCYQSSETSVP